MKSLSLGSYFKWSSWLALRTTLPFARLETHLTYSVGVGLSDGPVWSLGLYRAMMEDINWGRSQQLWDVMRNIMETVITTSKYRSETFLGPGLVCWQLHKLLIINTGQSWEWVSHNNNGQILFVVPLFQQVLRHYDQRYISIWTWVVTWLGCGQRVGASTWRASLHL